jgi:hypothetical protein
MVGNPEAGASLISCLISGSSAIRKLAGHFRVARYPGAIARMQDHAFRGFTLDDIRCSAHMSAR